MNLHAERRDFQLPLGLTQGNPAITSPGWKQSQSNSEFTIPGYGLTNLFRDIPNGCPVPGVMSVPNNMVTIPLAY